MPNLARASLVLLGSLALAQDPAQSPAQSPSTGAPDRPARAPESGHIRADRSGLVLPAGAIDADELVDAVARFLGRSILWTAMEHGKAPVEPFVLQKELALDALGSEEVLSQMLWSRGFALVPLHADKGLYEILMQGGTRQRDIFANPIARTPEEILRQPALKLFVSTMFRPEHLDPASIQNLHILLAQASNNGQPVAVYVGRTLLLSGMQDQLALALRILKTCDHPEEQPRRTELEARVAAIEKSVQELRRAEAPLNNTPTNAPASTSTSQSTSPSGGK